MRNDLAQYNKIVKERKDTFETRQLENKIKDHEKAYQDSSQMKDEIQKQRV